MIDNIFTLYFYLYDRIFTINKYEWTPLWFYSAVYFTNWVTIMRDSFSHFKTQNYVIKSTKNLWFLSCSTGVRREFTEDITMMVNWLSWKLMKTRKEKRKEWMGDIFPILFSPRLDGMLSQFKQKSSCCFCI